MFAVLCPVCNGNGLVSNGFYSHPGDCPHWVSDGVNPELCQSCKGKGWLQVGIQELDDRPIKYPDNITCSPDNTTL